MRFPSDKLDEILNPRLQVDFSSNLDLRPPDRKSKSGESVGAEVERRKDEVKNPFGELASPSQEKLTIVSDRGLCLFSFKYSSALPK